MSSLKKKSIKPQSGKTKGKWGFPTSTKQAPKRFADVQKLVHLLEVSQIELEHQNQELRITEQELEASRNKYVNLFDFSPIPYFALDSEGIVKEVNLRAGTMLGVERRKLIGKKFASFIPLEEKIGFSQFIDSIFNSSEKQSCKTSLINKEKRVFHVLLEGVKLENPLEPSQQCQIALIDQTDFIKMERAMLELTAEFKLLKSGKK